MKSSVCPSRERIGDYLAGLGPAEDGDVERHLASCPHCQAEADALDFLATAGDPLVALLQGEGNASGYFGEPQCRQAMDLALRIGIESGGAPAACQGSSPAGVRREEIGKFILLEEIGHGGMGVVYKARHKLLGQIRAVKVLDPQRTKDQRLLARFLHEIKATGRLHHPNLIQATDADEDQGTHYLVMEYIDGWDLGRLVRAVGPLPIAEACELIRQTADALEHIHRQGMVHRDIKPSNIMLASDGQVRVLDLGLALLRDPESGDLTDSGQVMGTYDYIAPEQVDDSHRVDIRADLYSLGCTLYQFLSGSPPFSGSGFETPIRKIRAHCDLPVRPIWEVRPEVPEALAAVVMRLLAKAPGDRFPTPAEVSEALAPFCRGADLPALLAQSRAAPRGSGPGQPVGDSRPSWHAPTDPNRPRRPVRPKRGAGRLWLWLLLLAMLAPAAAVALHVVMRIGDRDRGETALTAPQEGEGKTGAGQEESAAPGPSQQPKPAAAPTAMLEKVQVQFVGPEGMVVYRETGGPRRFGSAPLVCPGRQHFEPGKTHQLKIGNIPQFAFVELYPTLELPAVTPATAVYLAHNAVGVELHRDDFERALSGQMVTRVFWLPGQEQALAGVDSRVSTRLDQPLEPLAEIGRRGTVLAVVRMGNQDLEPPETEVKDAAAAPLASKNPKSVGTGDPASELPSFTTPDGVTCVAMSLLVRSLGEDARGHDVVVLCDTAAGMTGQPREQAMEVVKGLLASLRADDRVQLWAYDVNAVPMGERFAAPGSAETAAALEKLQKRAPLGAADAEKAVRSAAAAFAGPANRPRAVFCVGRGFSAARFPTPAAVDSLAAALVSSRVSLSGYVIGARSENEMLATLAAESGGMLYEAGKAQAQQTGAKLAASIHATVLWPTKVVWPEGLEVFAKRPPPLRSDRSTVVIAACRGRGPFTLEMAGDAPGGPRVVLWRVIPGPPRDENDFLADLVRQARGNGGLALPVLGSEGLVEAARRIRSRPSGAGAPGETTTLGHGALVTSPARLPGVWAWTIETRESRGATCGKAFEDIQYSPTGSLLATSGQDGTVRLRNAQTGAVERILVHGSSVTSLAWSPDGHYLASADAMGIVHLWQVETGRHAGEFAAPGSTVPMAWSPDGSLLAIGHEIRQARSGNLLQRLATFAADRCVSWSPDGRLLAVAGRGSKLTICEAGSGKVVRELEGHPEEVAWAGWSPRGGRLASLGVDGRIRVWNAETWQCDATLLVNLIVFRDESTHLCAWSPDGRSLACADGLQLRTWDATTPELTRTLEVSMPAAKSVSWSHDGRSLATAGAEALRILDATTGKPKLSIVNHNASRALRSSDARAFVIASKKNFFVVRPGAPREAMTDLPGDALFQSPDGKTVAVWSEAAKTIRLWETSTGRSLGSADIKSADLMDLEWSPDARRLAAVDRDDAVRVIDIATGTSQSLPGESAAGRRGPFECSFGELLSWSAGSHYLASQTAGREVQVWNADSARLVKRLAGKAAEKPVWSPSGARLAWLQEDHRVILWDAASDKSLPTLETGRKGRQTLSWSPDAKRLAIGAFSAPVQIWDVETGTMADLIPCPTRCAADLAWSPNGDLLAVAFGWNWWNASGGKSTCTNGGLYLWERAEGTVRHLLRTPGYLRTNGVLLFHWSPDGKRLTTGHGDGALHRWDAASGKLVESLPEYPSHVCAMQTSQDGTVIVATGGNEAHYLRDAATGEFLATLTFLSSGECLAASPEGHYWATPGIEKDLVYVARTDAGQQTYSPEEFSKRFGWKNDPSKVILGGGAAAAPKPSAGPGP